MKLSITLTLATIASMSVGSEARIGGGEKYEIYVSNTCHNDVTAREQNKNQGSVVKASSCKLWDSGTTKSLQSFIFDTQSNKAGTGSVQCQKKPNPYECQQFMMHKKLPDNACVIKVPSSMCDDRNRQLEDPDASKAAEERAAARKAAEQKEPDTFPLMPVQTAHVEVVPHAPCVGTGCMAGVSPYTVFVANTQQRPVQAGLIDGNDNPISYNDVKGGECIQIGDYVIPDAVTYFTNPKDGSGGLIFDDVADCEYIGNTNNAACDLPNLPENACVILV